MTWQLILFIAIFANAFSLILGKFIINDQKCSPASFSIIFQTLTGLFILVYAYFVHEVSLNTNDILFYFLLSPFLYIVVNLLRANALKITDSSEYMVLLSTGSVWSMVLAVIFLNENVTVMQVLGVVLIVLSVVIVSRFNLKKLKLKKGEVLVILCALFSAIAFINDAYILRQNYASIYAAYAFLAPGVITMLMYPKDVKNAINLFNKRNSFAILVSTFLCAVAVVGIYKAYQLGRNAALIVPLNQTTTIIVVVLGILLLKERKNIPPKLIAALISFIGVVLVTI